MKVSGQIHVQTALPRRMGPCTHWIEDWVGLRAGLDAVTKRKNITDLAGNRTPVVQRVD
jgi:hypothetical protein